MEVRITKLRVAMAALFVLAGVGLASLLSPLVGTALATVGQVVNISDHSASAYFAKVDSDREAGRRRRRRAAERGRNGHGSSGCTRVSVARSKRHPGRSARSSPGRARHRSTSPACPSRPTPRAVDGVNVVCAATTFRTVPPVAPARSRRRHLGHSATWATA